MQPEQLLRLRFACNNVLPDAVRLDSDSFPLTGQGLVMNTHFLAEYPVTFCYRPHTFVYDVRLRLSLEFLRHSRVCNAAGTDDPGHSSGLTRNTP